MFVIEKRRILPFIDTLLALLPCVLIGCYTAGADMLFALLVCLFSEGICNIIYCCITKRAFDFTLLSFALVSGLFIGRDNGLLFAALCGIVVFLSFLLCKIISEKTRADISLPALSIFIVCLLSGVLTSSDYITDGVIPAAKVADLLTGLYSAALPFLSSSSAILFAFIYLSVRKKIKPFGKILGFAVFVFLLSLLYKSDEITQLTFLSFISLDGKIVFALLIISGIYNGSGIMYNIITVITGAFSALVVSAGFTTGVYLIPVAVSLLSPLSDRIYLNLRFKGKRVKK